MSETAMTVPGGYTWQAILRDGSERTEFETGEQQSIGVLHDLDVASIILIPKTPHHRTLVMDIAPGESWKKFWTHTFLVVGDHVNNRYTIDVCELSSPRPVRVYIYPDGTIRLTTNQEP
ncbi:MAG: hypothetical protein E6R03_15145 [Hyphomicrobiaceae bacterium]|nr:MAG: hypothetical protein E6R03_15145 [Hyphomicrobiaceae bacterium]